MVQCVGRIRRTWRKAAVLCAVGVAISLIRKTTSTMAEGAFFSDTFFTIGSLLFLAGLIGIVKNLGVFNSLKYGTKSLVRMFRGEKEAKPDDAMLGGYLEYVRSRPKDKDMPWLLLYAFVFFVLAVLTLLPLL